MSAPTADRDTMNQTTMELHGDREIVIERTFNGPPHIVFAAWTKPEFVRHWWAPRALGLEFVSCDADVRAGGSYRYVLLHRTGEHLAFSGEYIEVTPHARLVYTQIFEPMAGNGHVTVTVTFTAVDGKTHVRSAELSSSPEVRDAIIKSGMEKGMRITMDQLDELVASLA